MKTLLKHALVIGSVNCDSIYSLSRMPSRGETLSADQAAIRAGGKGANQAVQLAKLGIKTRFAGAIGRDAVGDAMEAKLDAAGLDLTYLHRVETPTGSAAVMALRDGSAYAVIAPGANGGVTEKDIPAPVFEGMDIVLLQLEIPVEANVWAAETARRLGIPVVLNAAPARKIPESLLRCNYVVVNEVEAAFYAGQGMDEIETVRPVLLRLAKTYGNSWICTLGNKGSVVSDGSRTYVIPAIGNLVVETTGAGDSFIGGFSYGVLHGCDLRSAAFFGAYCSSLTIRRIGAQEAMPTSAELISEYPNLRA